MKATIEIRDMETDETLETLGTLIYEGAGMAIQNCEKWYADEIAAWEERNYQVEIVLVDQEK